MKKLCNKDSRPDLELRLDLLEEGVLEACRKDNNSTVVDMLLLVAKVRMGEESSVITKLSGDWKGSRYIMGLHHGDFIIASRADGSNKIKKLKFYRSEIPAVIESIRWCIITANSDLMDRERDHFDEVRKLKDDIHQLNCDKDNLNDRIKNINNRKDMLSTKVTMLDAENKDLRMKVKALEKMVKETKDTETEPKPKRKYTRKKVEEPVIASVVNEE